MSSRCEVGMLRNTHGETLCALRKRKRRFVEDNVPEVLGPDLIYDIQRF
jgi:hypothetical protein